jgi:outer membrane protein
MKNLPIILSSIALAGVLFLFFTKGKSKEAAKTVTHVSKDSAGKDVIVAGVKIAYVDIDTLQSNYNYFKQKKAEFESRQKNIDAELERTANTLQNDYIALQKKAQAGSLSQAEGEKAQQSLGQRQQELELKKQNLGSKFIKDQEAFNKEIFDNLHKIIEEYNTTKGYDYILSYSKDGSILYANKELDVTQDIIKDMNNLKSAK